MERTGVVKAVDGEWLEIEFCRPADCEKCNACRGGQKVMSLRLRGRAKVGDQAVVSLPAGMVTRASILVYALPLAGLLVGMALGERFIPLGNSLGTILGGVVGVVLPALALVLTEKRRQHDPRWQPQLVRVLPLTDE